MSPAHRNTHRLTLLPSAGIADAVDGGVGPLGGRARKWGGVGVVGRGVEGEHDEAFVVAPVHLDFADVEKGGVVASQSPAAFV